jgi:predicted dehydrogenase
MTRPSSPLSRRRFLRGTAAVGAAAFLSNVNTRALGANDDLRVAVVGAGGRGSAHINDFLKMKGVRLAALVDPDQTHLDKHLASVNKTPANACKGYSDIRKMLDSKEIDAIAIATPNHWHSLATIWACQAGVDVYVEKPISHEVWEGQKCIEAMEKYKRVVQHGTQRRSDQGYYDAYDYIRKGNLGAVKWVKGFCYKPRPSIGKVAGPTPIPAGVDYDLWCGPAPKEPLMRHKLHYDWHWVWPTGNGDIGNQGVHEMDLCRWFIGNQTLPDAVMSVGGRFGYEDDATTPNTLISYYDFKPMPFIFEVRGLPRSAPKDAGDGKTWPPMDAFGKLIRVGVWIECENGHFAAGEGGGFAYDKDDKKIKEFKQNGPQDHLKNFVHACRTRKPEDNRCDAKVAHLSAALCHLGNISYRAGQEVPMEQVEAQVKANNQLGESVERMKDHLAKNEVDFKTTKITLGAPLTIDPKAQRFVGEHADAGNKYLKRDYRKPYEIPENV